jgi:hypothetical protein
LQRLVAIKVPHRHRIATAAAEAGLKALRLVTAAAMSSALRRAPVAGSKSSNALWAAGCLPSYTISVPSESHCVDGTLATRRPSSPKIHSMDGADFAGVWRAAGSAAEPSTATAASPARYTALRDRRE